jgi:hypothetical protein
MVELSKDCYDFLKKFGAFPNFKESFDFPKFSQDFLVKKRIIGPALKILTIFNGFPEFLIDSKVLVRIMRNFREFCTCL